jgi:hypothetical protein
MLTYLVLRESRLCSTTPRAMHMCTSRTPRPALTAPHQHDVTAALSGLAAQEHGQGFGATFDATRLHARRRDGAHRGRLEDAASCGYRYTTSTRL